MAEQGLRPLIPGEPCELVDRADEHGWAAEVDVLIHHICRDARHEVVLRSVEVAVRVGASDLKVQQLSAGPVIRMGKRLFAPRT